MGLVATKTPAAERNRWRTPPEVFAYLNGKHGPFTLDAAADEENHLCDIWLGPGGWQDDALAVVWGGGLIGRRAYCNPPYDLTREFIAKAEAEVRAGNIYSATLLVPATTDVRWWHEYVWEGDRPRPGVLVEFSRGRIRFLRPDGTVAGTPTHGSAFVTFCREGQGHLF